MPFLLLLLAALLAATTPALAVGLDGQTATVEWRVPQLGTDRPLPGSPADDVVTRTFTVGKQPGVTDLGFYPSVSLEASDEALVFSFSTGWCCLSLGADALPGPVVTFTSLPEDRDLEVTVGDGTIGVTPADLLVTGNRIALNLRGRDISGGRLTLLVRPGSNLAERATLALIGVGLIALGTVRRRWLA